jgi:hypothetical protein
VRDLVFVLVVLVFFGVALAVVRACERVAGSGAVVEEGRGR